MERGGGAPPRDGDLTAEAIIGAAIPMRRSTGRIPNVSGPLLHRVRRPALAGIDGKASVTRRRQDYLCTRLPVQGGGVRNRHKHQGACQ